MKSSRKSTDMTANTPYHSRPIRRIQDFDESKDHCLTLKNTPYPHQRYAVYNTLVNDEELIGFTSICCIHQEDTAYLCLHFTRNHKYIKTNTPYPESSIRKARRCGKVYNWETATYGKIWDNEDVHDLGSVETEFPAIVFNDTLTSEATLSCEPTVSSLNNDEFDCRISFDESDDEDCTPTVSYFDDLDYFKDFENEFPAIVYNDALTSKSDFLAEPTLCTQHIDEFDLKEETSLSECDEEEKNVLNFNDLFPFNVIYPFDSKSDKDNDDDKVDIEHSSGDQYGVSWGMDTAYRLPV
ncbi:hypothetical protein Tco_1202054 [Tanacetum coccineum]